MLQNTVNTYAYKKYGVVTPEETVDHVRNMAPDFSGQTLMEAFHSTKKTKIPKIFESSRKFGSCRISAMRFNRKLREQV